MISVAGLVALAIGGALFVSKKDEMLQDTDNLEKHPKLKEFLQAPGETSKNKTA